MTAVEPERPVGFAAASVREFQLRAVAGGLVATAVVVAVFCAVGFGWPFLLLLGGCGAAGMLVSWSWERRRPAARPELRYGLVGTAAAAGALLLLGGLRTSFLLVAALVALPSGAAGGALAGVAAARLPTRQLVPAVCIALASLVGSAAVAVARTLPWLPGSYLVAEGPTTATSAEQLADQVVAELRVAPDRLSDATWEKVASSVVAPRGGGAVRIGYDRTPTSRQITVVVDGERACVDVRVDRVTSAQGDCPRR